MSVQNLETLGDRVLVRRDPQDVKSEGGIWYPDRSKPLPKQGTVIAMGTGGKKRLKDGTVMDVPFQVELGDRVLFNRWGGIEIEHEGETLLIMPQEEILAVLEPI